MYLYDLGKWDFNLFLENANLYLAIANFTTAYLTSGSENCTKV